MLLLATRIAAAAADILTLLPLQHMPPQLPMLLPALMRHIRCCCGRFAATDQQDLIPLLCCHNCGQSSDSKKISDMFFLLIVWMYFKGLFMFDLAGVKIQEAKHIFTHTYFLNKKFTFNLLNFLKLSVHVFCLAEKGQIDRTNSRTDCTQNKNTVCHHAVYGTAKTVRRDPLGSNIVCQTI